ncbi:hypothetical protein [Polaromonas sp. LjRoot131]|uniref:hypothetical protein n=1 Tax=Polaromonas sp. LjRoot131 TaxID=3342262 RepID=UPI003ED14E8E
MQNAAGDIVQSLQQAGGDTVATLKKAGSDTINTYVKAGQDASATYVKAWKDSAEQTKQSFQDTVDAATAATNYTINQLKAYEDATRNAEKRLRDGKVIDSMWGLAVEPLQASEANFAKATQESSLIATAAASTAAVYGGPGGAAAYAAWSTYRATGNADQALRAGLLAAATAQAGTSVASMPSGTMGEVLKKSAMAGAAGGIAIAAAGGDEQAIKDGFLKSAGAVLVQAGNEKAKAYSPKVKGAWDTVQCISARDLDCVSKTTWAKDARGKILTDANGKPRIDPTKLDPQQQVGKWTGIDPSSVQAKRNAIVAKISQLPKVEAIPLMRNEWVLSWSAGKTQTVRYGEPTVVLTYMGSNPPFISSVSYGRGEAAPSWINGDTNSKLASFYTCTLAGVDRTVRVSKRGGGCEAIYRRDDGEKTDVYHSNYYPDICAGEAAKFVATLRSKGVRCTAH